MIAQGRRREARSERSKIRRLPAQGGRAYLGRSAACRGFVTEGIAWCFDLVAEVSRGHISRASGESPNRDREQWSAKLTAVMRPPKRRNRRRDT